LFSFCFLVYVPSSPSPSSGGTSGIFSAKTKIIFTFPNEKPVVKKRKEDAQTKN